MVHVLAFALPYAKTVQTHPTTDLPTALQHEGEYTVDAAMRKCEELGAAGFTFEDPQVH